MASKKTAEGVIDAAARAAADLDATGATYALIGGLAVAARGEPRFTRDVDLVVDVADDAAAERLLHQLTGRGYSVVTVVEQTRTGRLATARLLRRGQAKIFVDLLFASSGIEPELVAGAERLEYRRGLFLPVAQVGHLIALKVLSESKNRLQDRIDLRTLADVASAADWATARAAVRLIRERGCHRGRALRRRLRQWGG